MTSHAGHGIVRAQRIGRFDTSRIGTQIDRYLQTLREQLPKAAPPPPTYLIAQWQKEMDARRAALR